MCISDLTYGEAYFYEHDTLYRQTIKEIVISMGLKLIRPSMYQTEIYSGMDGFLNMTGKLRHRRYRE